MEAYRHEYCTYVTTNAGPTGLSIFVILNAFATAFMLAMPTVHSNVTSNGHTYRTRSTAEATSYILIALTTVLTFLVSRGNALQ